MWAKKEKRNNINKGKICETDGCNFNARVKGYCVHCYTKIQKSRKMTYKKAGVDIEKENQAIRILTKDMTEDGKRGIILTRCSSALRRCW